ncbi:hypothetical protein AB0P21_00710 [Kribbella sp. NPDC056861]|uniref:hypothetical protein n=1 Tax=Kribbella sp. NPDC056861 TaxID=3154857 RepID=UPI003416E749
MLIRRMTSALTVACAVAVLMPTSAPAVPQRAVVVSERLTTGNDFFVYVPKGDTGYRAASTPILLVLGDRTFTSDSARRTAESSGLARIAADQQGVVAFVNPAGPRWQAGDTAGVAAALARFGDSTGTPYDHEGKLCSTGADGQLRCLYPGTKARVYLFADGAGADFVSRRVVPGIDIPAAFPRYDGTPVVQSWTPTAVTLFNPHDAATRPVQGAEVPAYVVNGSRRVDDSYRRLNNRHGLFGEQDRAARHGFDSAALRRGYERVVRYAIHRTAETNTALQVYRIPDYADEGISVRRAVAQINGRAQEYTTYVPRSASHRRVPLVLTFHGGGSDADYHTIATGWPLLAKQHGFMVVSVNRHVERTGADIVALLDRLQREYPAIDSTRVYATGFSMGSVKTWELGTQFAGRFAAIAPSNGSFGPVAAIPPLVMPTIYFAGENSPLPESPHQRFQFFQPNDKANDIDARLAALFAQNHVTPNYVYNAAADLQWGIAARRTSTVHDREFADVTVTIKEYPSVDGRRLTALASIGNASHEPLPSAATAAWTFMSSFARLPNGSVVTTGL